MTLKLNHPAKFGLALNGPTQSTLIDANFAGNGATEADLKASSSISIEKVSVLDEPISDLPFVEKPQQPNPQLSLVRAVGNMATC